MTVTRYPPTERRSLKEELLQVLRATAPAIEATAPTAPAEAAKPAPVAPEAPAVARTGKMNISPTVRARAARMRPAAAQRGSSAQAASQAVRVFEPARLPPGVGDKDSKIAMDSALQTWAQDSFQASWDAGNTFGSAFVEGQFFLGFTYLAELTQRPEYRRISERIATEMTRKWIRLTTAEAKDEEIEGELDDEDDIRALIGADRSGAFDADEDAEGQKDGAEGEQPEDDDSEGGQPEEDPAAKKRSAELQLKVKAIDEELKRFGVRDKFCKIAEHDGSYGRSHLYVDTGDKDNPKEMLTDLGDGSAETTGKKLNKGQLKGFKVIEPMWCYPLNYNARDTLDDDWYNPQVWLTMQRQIHRSRLIPMVGREVADILKPAYAFAGLSMSQMAKPYVDNWLRTRQAVTNLIESFSVSGVYTNAQSLLEGGGGEVLDRIEIFNITRTNAGTMVLDKETEEFFNVSTPLGTLDALQAQSQEQMSAVSGIPLVVLLGITPKGLNASSEGEIRVFYDWIHAFQEKFFRPVLTIVINLIQLNLWGKIDPEIGFEFEPLWSLDEKARAEVAKVEMETHTGYIDNGTISPEEVRGIVISNPDLPYTGLDPNDVPEPPAQEGLLPPGGGQGGAGGGESDRGEESDPGGGGQAQDAWNESDHPRGQPENAGQFGEGGGGSHPAPSKTAKSYTKVADAVQKRIVSAGGSKQVQQEIVEAAKGIPDHFASSLENFPIKVIKNFSKSEVNSMSESLTSAATKEQVAKGMNGLFDGDKIIIPQGYEVPGKMLGFNVSKVEDFSSRGKVFIHEAGHAIDSDAGEVWSKNFGPLVKSEASKAGLSDAERKYSRYFTDDPSEAFAELFSLTFSNDSDAIYFGCMKLNRALQVFKQSVDALRSLEPE